MSVEDRLRAGLAGRPTSWTRPSSSGWSRCCGWPPRGATAGGSFSRVRGPAPPDYPGCREGIGTGLYQWRSQDGAISVRVVGSDCDARRILFAESSWSPVP
jgi:hypothetical protein